MNIQSVLSGYKSSMRLTLPPEATSMISATRGDALDFPFRIRHTVGCFNPDRRENSLSEIFDSVRYKSKAFMVLLYI